MRKPRQTYADVAADQASRGSCDDAAGDFDADKFAARIEELIRTGQADQPYPGPTQWSGELKPGLAAKRYLTPEEQAELQALEERQNCTPTGLRGDPAAENRYRELKGTPLA